MDNNMRTPRISKHRYSTYLKTKSRYSKRRRCSCFLINWSHVEFPKIWSELRDNCQLCDGLVHCTNGNAYFHVHRAILSAASPYFRALFTNSLNGGNPDVKQISVDDVPPDAMKLILDYAYTGKCDVNQENVERLLSIADQFEVLGVLQLCCRFLRKELQPENCIGIFTFACHYSCHELEEYGWRFILSNFMEIVQKSNEILAIDKDLLQKILRDDYLNVRQEEMAFMAVKLWVEADVESRRRFMPSLLQCIHFGLMKKSFFDDKVMKWDLLKKNVDCKPIITEAAVLLSRIDVMQAHSPTVSATSIAIDLNHSLARPRIPYEILFAVGGWSSGNPTSFIETYDSRSDRWYQSLPADTNPRAYHGAVALNGCIYMIGGFDGVSYFNTLCQYNPATKMCRNRACMYNSRCYVSTCTLDGKIYAIGGYNGVSRLKSVERYSPATNQWEMLPSMHCSRSDAGASALNGKVYVVGGFNGQDVLSSVEVFDPKTKEWSYMRSMENPRSGVSVAVYHGDLYVLGGFNGVNRLSSFLSIAEKYSPSTSHRWLPVPDMLNPRSNFSAIQLDDSLYVVGGFNGHRTVQLVEFYNDKTDEWRHASPMNLNRSALSVCVLSGLSNARDYSHLSKVTVVGEGRSDNGEGLPEPLYIVGDEQY